ncbi:MAG: PAS domain S-box protein [Vicinamibacteria bacterium]|nr:PAS domain S-box protein [Vicinamibacteria bacterium]
MPETSHATLATRVNHSIPETLFQTTFDLAVDGMFIAEPDGKCVAVNPRVTELTGYSRDELLGMTFHDLMSPEDLAQNPIRMDDLSQGTIVTDSHYLRRKDGHILPVEISGRLLPDGRILETVRDISERRRAEESLRRSEMRYRALIESQIDLVSRYRSDTILTFVNDAYCKFYGKTREELIGQSFMFMVAPEFRDIVAKETENLAKDPASLVVGEYLNYNQAGKECWIQWIVHSITDENGRVLELQAVGRDITHLKQTEEALRQANIVVESSPVVLFRWKTAEGWPVEYVSKNVVQFGYTVDELLAGDMAYIELVHPDDRHRFVQEIRKYSAAGADRFQQEYRILTKNGDVRWVDDRTAVQRDDQGRIMHYQGIVIDVTERKRAEKERGKLQTQLYQAQRMESVGRLAGGVAHDFNNMLTAILGHTQMAMTKVADSDTIHKDLDVIERCTLRSAAIVRQLLAFARQQPVAPKVLDLNDTVTGMLKMLQRLIGEDVDIAWRPGADLWFVRIDPSQIDQLLANLCVNARDAIAGVGKIIIESDNAVFDEAFCDAHPGFMPGQYVMLAVSDNGCGMDGKMLDHIFEPFFTTKEIGKGTGLGLATVYGIVKQNEGFINVYSEPGKGTVLKVYLPRCVDEPVERLFAAEPEIPRGRGETVLLVEDEESILLISKSMLEELGYRVLIASTPGEALRLVETDTGHIALLLTDVIMPEMNGRALAALIGGIHPRLKCLYSSGYTADVIAHRGILDEHVHFLQKPFTIRELAVKMREALETA